MNLVDAHPDAIAADLRRRKQGMSLRDEGIELSGSLRAFIRAAWHVLRPDDEYYENWHIGAMCELLEEVTAGTIRKLMIWVPPGSMKTITTSICWPTWEWTFQPSTRYLTCSYDMDIAVETGALPARDLILSPWYQERWGHVYALKGDLNKKSAYANDHGGARYCGAPNAKKITGRHVHRILLDDPNDAASVEAISDDELQKINGWHDGTLPTRYANPKTGAKVVIQQRLHENDLSGHLHDDEWTVLCLPERFDPNHQFVWPMDPRTEDGQLLWPDRIDELENRARRRELGGHRAAGQLQQEPAAREGTILKRAYWSYYPEDWVALAEEGDISRLPPFRLILYSWDCSFKDKAANDPVAGGIFGVLGGDRYLLKTRYERMSLSATKTAMLELRNWGLERFPHCAHKLLIEKKANGNEIIAQFKRLVPGVTAYNPGNLDKTERAVAAEPDFESGNVWVPGAADGKGDYDPSQTPAWAQEVIEQCARFPNGRHDDLVDMCTQAVNWVRGKNVGGARIYSPADVRLPELAGVPSAGSSILRA